MQAGGIKILTFADFDIFESISSRNDYFDQFKGIQGTGLIAMAVVRQLPKT